MSALPPKADIGTQSRNVKSRHWRGYPTTSRAPPPPTKQFLQSENPSVNWPGMCAMRELMPSAGFVLRCVKSVRGCECQEAKLLRRRIGYMLQCAQKLLKELQTSKTDLYFLRWRLPGWRWPNKQRRIAKSIRPQSRFSGGSNPEQTSPKRRISGDPSASDH